MIGQPVSTQGCALDLDCFFALRRARAAAGPTAVAALLGGVFVSPSQAWSAQADASARADAVAARSEAQPRADAPQPGLSPLAADAQSAEPEGASSASQPDQAWTFERLLGAARERNPAVLAEAAGARAETWSVKAARSQYFPTPDVQIEGSGGDREVIGSLTQPLVTFGRIGAGVAVARTRSDVAEARTEETRYSVSLRVLDAYGRYLSALRSIAVAQRDVERLDRLAAMIKVRVAAGISAPMDQNLVLSRLTQARAALTSLRAQQSGARESLSQLVGTRLSGEAVQIPQVVNALTPEQREESVAKAAGLLGESRQFNPGLKRLSAEIKAADAEERRARTALNPTVFARFEQRSAQGLYRSTFPDSRVVFGLRMELGPGLSTYDEMKAAGERSRNAEFNRAAAEANLNAELVDLFENYRAAQELVASLSQNAALQQETVDSYNRMFLAGKRSWLDLLNVIRDQAGIERELSDAQVKADVLDLRLRIEAGVL